MRPDGLTCLFVAVCLIIIIIGSPGCNGQQPDLRLPDSMGEDLRKTDEQAEKVRKGAEDSVQACDDTIAGKKSLEYLRNLLSALFGEATALKIMTGKNVVKGHEIDKQTKDLYDAGSHYRKELNEHEKKIAAQKRLMLFLKIGALIVLVVFGVIVAVKLEGWARTWLLIGVGGGVVGLGIAIALDFIEPFAWVIVALAVIAVVVALGKKLGWWEWAAVGVSTAVKRLKADPVADVASDLTPPGFNAALKRRNLSIRDSDKEK